MKKIAALFLTAALSAHSAAQADKARQTLSADGGRFVLGQIGEYANSQYLLDTRTGRVWEIINVTDEGKRTGTALRQIKFYTNDGRIWGDEPPPAGQTTPNR